MAATLTIFYGRLRGKACYQFGHSAQYSGYGFTITYVHFGNLSLFASYAMLMRPKKRLHSNIQFFNETTSYLIIYY